MPQPTDHIRGFRKVGTRDTGHEGFCLAARCIRIAVLSMTFRGLKDRRAVHTAERCRRGL
jgi:hypothetical protein